jgi:hypothetical protein
LDDLGAGRVYGRRTDVMTAEDASRCARLMGEPQDEGVPLSFAFVLALRALIGAGFLPGGAVMLGHRVRWLRRPRLGETLETEVRIVSLERERGRLTVGYGTRDADGRVVIEQEQDVRWPRDS